MGEKKFSVKTHWLIRLMHWLGVYPKSTALVCFVFLQNKTQPITVSLADPDSRTETGVTLLSGTNLSIEAAKEFMANMQQMIDRAEAFSGR